jgi:hypothetical protein
MLPLLSATIMPLFNKEFLDFSKVVLAINSGTIILTRAL